MTRTSQYGTTMTCSRQYVLPGTDCLVRLGKLLALPQTVTLPTINFQDSVDIKIAAKCMLPYVLSKTALTFMHPCIIVYMVLLALVQFVYTLQNKAQLLIFLPIFLCRRCVQPARNMHHWRIDICGRSTV
mgnify:CR=1 FL=1